MLSILETAFGYFSTEGDLSSSPGPGSQARNCNYAMSEGCSTAGGDGTANGVSHRRAAVPTETLGAYASSSNSVEVKVKISSDLFNSKFLSAFVHELFIQGDLSDCMTPYQCIAWPLNCSFIPMQNACTPIPQ